MKRILCIGDSNTCGFDPRSCLGSRYPREIRWTGRIAASGFEVVNDGVNGRTFPRGTELPALSARLQAKLPVDAVLILLHFVLGPEVLPLPVAITLGAIASATAPAATLMVVRQYKAKGPVTDVLLPVYLVMVALPFVTVYLKSP